MSGRKVQFHTLSLDIKKDIGVRLIGAGRKDVLVGALGKSFTTAASSLKQDRETLHVEFKGIANLVIKHKSAEPGSHQYDVFWSLMKGKELADEFSMRDSHWYGVSQIQKQTWPVEKWQRASQPFVCWDSYRSQEYGSVQERYWLNSRGAAIFVQPDVPLFAGTNEAGNMTISLTSKWTSPFKNTQNRHLYLNYTIFHHENVQKVHLLAVNEALGKPRNIPNEDMFRFPTWSTWARYKKEVNQANVTQFSDEIIRNGFKTSVFEIDDDWTQAYGDYQFHKKKFPSPSAMIKTLRDRGQQVSVWVHPFASATSSASGKSYWLKGRLKGNITWWNGIGKCLDVTNPAAVAWYKGCLRHLQQHFGVFSFKFDAGETNWLPSNFESVGQCENPNEYSTKFAELCAAVDDKQRAQKVRIGVRSQHLPIIVRIVDKDSLWTNENGLKSVIPNVLTFSCIGYVFCAPDTVGGNTQKGLPDRELYVRWLQVCALLPVLQFSVSPWQYDIEVVSIAKKMCDLHERWSEVMIYLGREAVRTGAPIIRPLWWVDPDNPVAQTIDSQFLVGDDLLVAPVLERGATSRAVYLLPGTWRDEITGKQLVGGRWYYGYPAQLGDLPHFTRVVQEPEPEPEPEPEEEVVEPEEEVDEPVEEEPEEEPVAAAPERELAGELSRAELIARLNKMYETPADDTSDAGGNQVTE